MRARRIVILLAIVGGFLFWPHSLRASPISHLVISEVQVAGSAADDEFIELYNPTDSAIDISGWSIQYKSATGAMFQKKNFTSGASVPARGFYLIARSAFDGGIAADLLQSTFALAGNGGNIFLVSNQTLLTSATDPAIVDKVSYGTGDSPEGTATGAPPANQSLERKPGGVNGNGTDTNNNAADFQLQPAPNPQNTSSPPLPAPAAPPPEPPPAPAEPSSPPEPTTPSPPQEVPTPAPTPSSETPSAPSSPTPPSAPSYNPRDLAINEFLPNPADGPEWIELYNNTTSSIDLSGWHLLDGTDGSIKALSGTLQAQGFIAFDLSGSRLNNDGDIIVLRAPSEALIDRVAYGNWNDGNAADNAPVASQVESTMARRNDGQDSDQDSQDFAVTTTPTKGLRNIITAPVLPQPSSPSTPSNPPASPSSETLNTQSQTPAYNAGDVVINEFLPDPLDNTEWIELYNKTNTAMDLNDWKILDGTGGTIKTLNGALPPNGFTAFDLTSARLNNEGDIITLKSPTNTVIDSASYGAWNDGNTSDNAPAPVRSGQSVARRTNGGNTENDQNDFALSDNPTKGASNIIATTQTVYTGGTRPETYSTPPPLMVINEFVADPAEGEEWVELFNAGQVSVDLAGWTLEEGSGSKTVLSGTLMPDQFKVIEKINGNLNNAGDTLVLKNDRGALIDKVAYGAWEDGNRGDNAPAASDPNSVARRRDGADTNRDSEDFTVTPTPTKGAPNTIPTQEMQSENTREIIFSEIMPNPRGAETAEWIELYNKGALAVSLAGLVIQDRSGARYTFGARDRLDARGFFIVEREASQIVLNNSNETISLLALNGNLLDRVQWENAQEGLAFAFADNAWTWTTTSTPGAANRITRPTSNQSVNQGAANNLSADTDGDRAENPAVQNTKGDLGGKLIINELLPNPEGSDDQEFIELFWDGGEPLNLNNFIIADSSKARPRRLSDITVQAKSFITLEKSTTKISLNNSGDSIALLDPSGALLDEIEYDGSLEGRSYSRHKDGQWLWTIPTPGHANIFDDNARAEAEDENERSASLAAPINIPLAQIREEEIGTRVRVTGAVAVLPGILGTQIFYLSGSGVQVYMYKKDFPQLQIGDVIQVTGTLAQSNGETRLKVQSRDDIKIERHGPPPEAHSATAADINEDWESGLITLQGTVIDTTKTGFTLDDGTSEAFVYIKNTTGLDLSEIVPGTRVAVTGIVGQYKDGYRVMPRFAEDIQILGRDELIAQSEDKNENQAKRPYAETAAVAGGGALIPLAIRRRRLFTSGLRALAFILRRGKDKNGSGLA